MHRIRGICRGCTRVVEASTLDDRRRCLRCAAKRPTYECRRCRNVGLVGAYERLECRDCELGRNPVVPRPPRPPKGQNVLGLLDLSIGTWPTSDGWRRIDCLRCDEPMWSRGNENRICLVCLAHPSEQQPDDGEEQHCTVCISCHVNVVWDAAGLCWECDAEYRGRDWNEPDLTDEREDE